MYSQRLFFLYKLPWNKEALSLRLQRILKFFGGSTCYQMLSLDLKNKETNDYRFNNIFICFGKAW